MHRPVRPQGIRCHTFGKRFSRGRAAPPAFQLARSALCGSKASRRPRTAAERRAEDVSCVVAGCALPHAFHGAHLIPRRRSTQLAGDRLTLCCARCTVQCEWVAGTGQFPSARPCHTCDQPGSIRLPAAPGRLPLTCSAARAMWLTRCAVQHSPPSHGPHRAS